MTLSRETSSPTMPPSARRQAIRPLKTITASRHTAARAVDPWWSTCPQTRPRIGRKTTTIGTTIGTQKVHLEIVGRTLSHIITSSDPNTTTTRMVVKVTITRTVKRQQMSDHLWLQARFLCSSLHRKTSVSVCLKRVFSTRRKGISLTALTNCASRMPLRRRTYSSAYRYSTTGSLMASTRSLVDRLSPSSPFSLLWKRA